MTTFEITYNLFKDLNKFEQKAIVQHFLDKMFDKSDKKDYSKNPCREIFEEKSESIMLTNSNKVCTNFFQVINKCDSIILTETEDDAIELVQLFNDSVRNGNESHDGYMLDEKSHIPFEQMYFDIDRYSLQVGSIFEYDPDEYRIILYKDFKNALIFE